MLWQIFLAFNFILFILIGILVFARKYEFAIVCSALSGAVSLALIVFLLNPLQFCNTTITGTQTYQVCETSLRNAFPTIVLTSLMILYSLIALASFWFTVQLGSKMGKDNEED
jgi:hypothetical protein